MFVAIVLLFIASSFFSGSETALTATNKIKLQTKAAQGHKKSERLLKLVDNAEEFIPGILIANNVPNIILPSLVTIVAIDYGLNVGIATGILTVLIIIFAEVLPKSVAAAYPQKISYAVYPLTSLLLKILKPFTFLLNAFTRLVIRLLGRNDANQASFSKDEMRAMVDIGLTEGTFKNDEVYRLKGMLDFEHLNVADVLQTPRIDVQGISADVTFEEAKEILLDNQYTRYPVYEEDIDHIIGVFHSKFVLKWSQEPNKPIREIADLQPLYVYEFHPVNRVFQKMLQEKKHFAIVLDEYGGTEGIITHEDLIEAMIGQDIEDETDVDDVLIEEQSESRLVCDGKISLRRLNNAFNVNIPEEEDNLASFLIHQFGYLPTRGEQLNYKELRFEILAMDEKKVERVQITKTIDPALSE
ncbi:CNNM domain-containing protein [Shouchella sp. JSM 1781072]|uniref:CNNM domain-containing protein n=1 Tax=Bacillaceae TaxID=186817 RepID=UPI000C0704B4|nr:CNNM domain-containing protein [Bacillus sp. Marseille-P3800]